MADLRASGLGGVPKGATADRPSSPSIGDVFYNGTLGCLEIYTAQGWVANSAPPGIPDIGTATYSATNKPYNNSSVSVTFTPGQGGGLPNSYRATSSPGGYSGTSTTSPITVSGLQSGIAYTFSVTGTNNFGTSAASVSSNSITANTVPDQPGTPVATYASSTSAILTFTPGANGGSTITNYKYSTDGTNYTALSPAQTTSPLTISGLTAFNTYTFYIKAVNSNGDSISSSASNSLFMGTTVTGGTLTSDATYYYRTFTGSGTLSVSTAPLTADILAVGGGGAGGWDVGGGGGAGGLTYSSSLSLSPTSYSITIGQGGPRPTSQAATSASSGQSTTITGSGFSTITALGGGGGGNYNGGSGASGGSGGGGAGYSGGQLAGGSATQGSGSNYTGYGNAGAAGRADLYSTNATGGGGGGAGSVGGASISNITGFAPGGSGLTYFGSTYAAGGKGGGDSWGGNTDAAANTGNGGDGAGAGLSNAGGAGGSGIVIFRYTKSQVGG